MNLVQQGVGKLNLVEAGQDCVEVSAQLSNEPRKVANVTDIFARFGFRKELVSDNGKQFIREEFEAFLKSCGIRQIRVSPYYARGNEKLERFHKHLKKNFQAVISDGKSGQKEQKTHRASPHQISGKSPSMLLFNHEICSAL